MLRNCSDDMPTITLSRPPGYSDLPQKVLTAESPALGIYLAHIAENAAFGMVRLEVFSGLYHDGETVGLPTSTYDGYNYSLSELTFCWAVQNSTNPSTHWLTGPDSLWYGAWLVDQATGRVSCVEAYRQSGDHPDPAISQDGTLLVFTIAQRLKTTILIDTQLTAYTDLANSEFAVDKPLSQRLFRQLNVNAKFSAVNGECIYMGEFYDGQTVPTAVSPADGYAYSYSQMLFTFSWRWTVLGSTFRQPNMGLGQLDRIAATVSSVGVVNTGIFYKASGAPALQANHGRIAVFAFCSRSNLINAIPSLANQFDELSVETFMPGEFLRASNLLQLNKNIREAVCSPEFFGPTNYNGGDTIPLPVSTLDGYTYTRDEIDYVWDWAHTTPQSTGNHIRLSAFLARIERTTGVVTVEVWRLPPGPSDYVTEPSGDSDDAIRVLVIGIRGASHPVFTDSSTIDAPSDATAGGGGGIGADNPGPDTQPYAISFDIGAGNIPTANQSLSRHQISGDLASVVFASGLPTSGFHARVASTSTYVVTIKRYVSGSPTSIGTITYSAGNLTAAITFSAGVTAVFPDEIEFVGQATPDATLSGIYGTMSGTRT